jgi:hypothetical protein
MTIRTNHPYTQQSTNSTIETTTEKKIPKIDLKGVVFCKAKKCMNSLYKNESSSFKGYCQDCG